MPTRTVPAWLGKLPIAAARLLMAEGFTDLDQVRAAIVSGRLHPGRTVGLGRTTWQTLCTWAEVSAPAAENQRPARQRQAIERAIRLLEQNGYKVIPPERRSE